MIHKIHDLFSASIYHPAVRLHRYVNASRRPTALAFQAGMRFRASARDWEPEAKKAWMLARLREIARYAYRHTEFYRDLFNSIGFDPHADFSFDDYALLPVLERETVRSAGTSIRSNAVPPEQLTEDSTGGSTGSPTRIWLGPLERGWRESATETFMIRIGMPQGTRTALLWGHHLDRSQTDNARDRWYAFANNRRWFDCFRLSAETLDAYHREFERWRPECILAYGGALGSLAEHLRHQGYRPCYPSIGLVTGAEKLATKDREAVTAVFGLPVHERYGSRDVGSIGIQITPASTLDFTIDWANICVEPETAEEKSAILITKLHADGMPMLRYRIGDMAHFPQSSRPGHPVLRLHEVMGRELDRIWLRDGSWIHSSQFPHMLKDYPVREYMFLQQKDYSVELKIVASGDFPDESLRRIYGIVRSNLPGITVTISLVTDLPRTQAGKLRPVISDVKLDQPKRVENVI